MPTFKHPCPHCGTFINRDVAACPACGRADPFAPARCANCRATISDPGWIACPACGQPVGAAAAAAAEAAAAAAAPTVASASETRLCSGCGAPLPSGASFCHECGSAAN